MSSRPYYLIDFGNRDIVRKVLEGLFWLEFIFCYYGANSKRVTYIIWIFSGITSKISVYLPIPVRPNDCRILNPPRPVRLNRKYKHINMQV